MRRRIRLKKMFIFFKNRKHMFIKRLLITFLFIIIFIGIIFDFISEKATPTLFKVAEIEAKKLSNIIINYSIQEEINRNNYINSLFMIKESNNSIQTIDVDPIITNKLLVSIITNISNNLKKIESGDIEEINKRKNTLTSYDINKMKKGIIYEITSGAVFGNTILANIGPKIPVKLNLVGNINGKIETRLENYGINNALIEVVLILSLEEMVVLPITSEKIEIDTEVVLATKLIQGNIPDYYNGFTPSVNVPVE